MSEILPAVFGSDSLLVGTLVPFLFVLTVVVFVHEMGHYLVGRWCGIGVKAFSIGFGPELIGFNDQRGTRWKLSAIPLGGYVKFVGDMNVVSKPDGDEIEALSDADRRVAFHTQPIWRRAATVVAGPLFNFLLTIVVFTAAFTFEGRFVREPTIAEVNAGSPAAMAGFLPGDRFVSVDGQWVETFDDVRGLVSLRAGDPLVFVVMRDGKDVTLTATPQLSEQKDVFGNAIKIGVIGVTTNEDVGDWRVVRYGPVGAFVEAVHATGQIISQTGQFLKRFVVGREDKCQLGGPIKIAKMSGQAATAGFGPLIQLVAMLSVGIGVLNLLPIPPLDGGHLLFYGAEAVMRRPVSERMTEMTYRVGMFLVLGFMAFVFWNDLFGC